MKQNLPTENMRAAMTAAVIFAGMLLFVSACATPPRSTTSITQLSSRRLTSSAININTATVRELEKLPGVGSGLAQRIVLHREQYGPFRRAEHLMIVRGISDRKFRDLRDMIVVE
jgi:competence protein ComEA